MKIFIDGKVRDTRAVWFENDKVMMIDQRHLPKKVVIVSFDDYIDVAKAIKNMTIRGAPSIGAAAAYAMCLAALKKCDLIKASKEIKEMRPTANDLFYAVDYMMVCLSEGKNPIKAAESYAQSIINKCIAIGKYGAELIKDHYKLMTHCNAGALATVDVGTAIAPMRQAWNDGKRFFVYVSETRPRLQGMKLTAWELLQEGIDHAIITDNSSGYFIKKGVDIVIVGADRIAANGDFANKIGTLEKAVLSKEFGVPFYVAAPTSTFDFNTKIGENIVIENREGEEVTTVDGVMVAPVGCKVLNPSFDVTPARYVTGFITDKGILKPNEIRKVIK